MEKSSIIPNKIFVGLPWKNVKKKYEHCIGKLKSQSPLYFHIVGRNDSQNAEDLLGRIKSSLNSSSAAIFDATGGNPNVSFEYGYAEAKELARSLYLSDHKASSKSTLSPIISDLAGQKQNRYKTERKLLELLKSMSDVHPYTRRYEQLMRQICRKKTGPQAKSKRALALKIRELCTYRNPLVFEAITNPPRISPRGTTPVGGGGQSRSRFEPQGLSCLPAPDPVPAELDLVQQE